MSNGDWYAFYTNTGPDSLERFDWCVEHPVDPNYWTQRPEEHRSQSETEWACRHGWIFPIKRCEDGCGPDGPITITDEMIEKAKSEVIGLLDVSWIKT